MNVIPYIAAALLIALPGATQAQGTPAFPGKPIRMIVPAAPGGNPDVLGRLLGQKLQTEFGVSVVVENQPGAGGVAAAINVVKSPADGHMLFLGESGALAIAPAMTPKLAYQPLKDFSFVTALAALPTVLVAHPSAPASLQDFIAAAKARPGQMNFGSAGPGSIHHLTMALFETETGTRMLHVPYKGGSPMVAAVMAGEVQAGFSGIPNVVSAIRAGRLRALGVSIPNRSGSLPEVPTLDELGVKGFNVATTIGVQAPAGVPREIVARLQQAFARAVREPDVAERMAAMGMILVEQGTAHYEELVRAELQRYAAAVKAAGIKFD